MARNRPGDKPLRIAADCRLERIADSRLQNTTIGETMTSGSAPVVVPGFR
jgi:hypothetical protein